MLVCLFADMISATAAKMVQEKDLIFVNSLTLKEKIDLVRKKCIFLKAHVKHVNMVKV